MSVHGRDAAIAIERKGLIMSSRVKLDPLLLTPEEVAEVLRVGRSKVYDLMRSNQLQSVKVGGCRRVPVAALGLLIERLTAEDVA